MVLLVEGAQRTRRGFVGSFASFGAVGGMLLGSAVGASRHRISTTRHDCSWGWRAAFLFGLVIGAIVLYVRRRLPPDTLVVAIAEARHSPVVTAFRTQWRTILKIIGIILTLGIGFYLNFVYLSTWLVQFAHISHSGALTLNCLGLALQLPLLPLAGSLPTGSARKAVLLLSTIGFAVLSWPLYVLIDQGTVAAIIGGQAVFAALQAGISAAVPAFMIEALPKHVRCSALSFGQNLSMACFGGTVPMVSVALIGATSSPLAPALYLATAGVVSFFVVAITNVLSEDGSSEVDLGARGQTKTLAPA